MLEASGSGLCKDYMSQKCYDDFVMKLGWMQVRNEVPVQKNETAFK